MFSGREECLSSYGVGVAVGTEVLDGVKEGGMEVKEGVIVRLGVHDGVMDAVSEGVSVKDGVRVAGWNKVGLADGVRVIVGVELGVLVFVPVRVTGVKVWVAVAVSVGVSVAVGVRLPAEGASTIATNPIQ